MRFEYTKAVLLPMLASMAVVFPLVGICWLMVMVLHWPAWTCIAMPLALFVLVALIADIRKALH